ncbi:tetratricopeptide repeat protein [Polynucleobacter sp. CS-Odin-A6]|uniref:O-linked N-acetylglucosamine transferase, SPINDLY family protein n=1 Tax=Polynucleobacter sp. CS-Odin-A6 TaxID=2689106 RepID=UPI001C0CB73B|nr:tetratricopeptide repeat protein [Polynucleobacter sp. CS-Odin-A6]MBU3621831.1 glycosyltransferase [Polynucleobacter sp. CS-Odin-A6]
MNKDLLKALELVKTKQIDQAIEKVYPLVKSSAKRVDTNAVTVLLYCLEQKRRNLEAFQVLQELLLKDPKNPKYHGYLAQLYMNAGELDNAIKHSKISVDLDPNDEPNFLGLVVQQAALSKDPLEIKALFESWAQRFMDPLTPKEPIAHKNDLQADRVLKIGYVSGDFKDHSVQFFIAPYLKLHDKSQFEVHAFMTMGEDDVTQGMKSLVSHWHSVEYMKRQDLFNLIQSLGIDILIDLSGPTAGHRLDIFAMKPAPIQLTWFGFMQTFGMKAIDYRITDWSTSPPGSEAFYTEKLFRLNGPMSIYQPPAIPEKIHPAPYQKNGFVTFLCMNHFRKVSDQSLRLWLKILEDHPTAKLMIISLESTAENAQASVFPRLQEIGIPLQRVHIMPKLPLHFFLNLGAFADFSVDPFPTSGGTTTLHAMWMGLPILALNNHSNIGTVSATANILSGLELSDCIANSEEEYRAIATEWILNPEKLNSLRSKCRKSLAAVCTTADHQKSVSDLEKAYRHMWLEYVDKQKERAAL